MRCLNLCWLDPARTGSEGPWLANPEGRTPASLRDGDQVMLLGGEVSRGLQTKTKHRVVAPCVFIHRFSRNY